MFRRSLLSFIAIGKRALFEPLLSLEDVARLVHSWELDHPVFTSSDFARSSALRPAPNLEDHVSIYIPQ
jgi:hypothetical protein